MLCFFCLLCRKENAIFPTHIHTTREEPYSAALYCLTDSLTGSDLKAKREIPGKREGEKSQSGFRSFGRNESLQSEDGSIYFMLSASLLVVF